jgi:stage II sporulation protein AB (anti-sigma F factor)
MKQEMKLEFDSIPSNESFARVVVAAFLTRLNPTMEEVADIKTAVSEAVTNAIIHGYCQEVHKIEISAWVEEDTFTVCVQDFGVGIEDVEKAMAPLYTTRRDLERSGMGFVFMEAFMDTVTVESKLSEGTKVTMSKKIGRRYEVQE